jgi:hypothetical protein
MCAPPTIVEIPEPARMDAFPVSSEVPRMARMEATRRSVGVEMDVPNRSV